ncbi:DUF4363 family protein [Pontibacillus marinus]|uniref:DUF4363 family protein n=1 Tax=Pontibacillus marinus BH030004 = DSM 16465 TaxID=1385511 RepID=A0A0A5G6H8_9BACI|nr:DUF4363 family protein [Pontibacillus marinus]KGX88731.1 hypothetical protein N783_07485 [Pontibacillus marinus BH030004 = DSM 16465]
MKKFLLYLIPILTLAIFIVIMNSGSILKKSYGHDDRLVETVKKIEKEVANEEWENAEEHIKYIEEAWKKVTRRIQFSVEKEFILEISGVFAQIKGGIKGKDDQAVMENIYFFYELWDNLAR